MLREKVDGVFLTNSNEDMTGTTASLAVFIVLLFAFASTIICGCCTKKKTKTSNVVDDSTSIVKKLIPEDSKVSSAILTKNTAASPKKVAKEVGLKASIRSLLKPFQNQSKENKNVAAPAVTTQGTKKGQPSTTVSVKSAGPKPAIDVLTKRPPTGKAIKKEAETDHLRQIRHDTHRHYFTQEPISKARAMYDWSKLVAMVKQVRATEKLAKKTSSASKTATMNIDKEEAELGSDDTYYGIPWKMQLSDSSNKI